MAANALLFAGDLGTGDSTQPLVAIVLGVGYLLLLAWFAIVGVCLLRRPPPGGHASDGG